MTITIELTRELEQEIRQAAAAAGVAVDSFIVQSVQERLGRPEGVANGAQRLPHAEADLLLGINESLSGFDWERYHHLMAKRQAEALAAMEQAELVSLSDQIEAANLQRIEHLAALARLRNTSVPALIAELGLKPKAHV